MLCLEIMLSMINFPSITKGWEKTREPINLRTSGGSEIKKKVPPKQSISLSQVLSMMVCRFSILPFAAHRARWEAALGKQSLANSPTVMSSALVRRAPPSLCFFLRYAIRVTAPASAANFVLGLRYWESFAGRSKKLRRRHSAYTRSGSPQVRLRIIWKVLESLWRGGREGFGNTHIHVTSPLHKKNKCTMLRILKNVKKKLFR